MWSRTRVVAALGLLLAVGLAWAADTYKTYHNARFDYRVLYPTFLIMEPPPENNDGRQFHSSDGKILFAVWGSYNALEQSLKDKYDERLQMLKDDGEQVDYKVLKDTFYVISYGSGRQISYERCAVSRERRAEGAKPAAFSSFQFVYDSVHKNRMDKVIAKVSPSLSGPSGE